MIDEFDLFKIKKRMIFLVKSYYLVKKKRKENYYNL